MDGQISIQQARMDGSDVKTIVSTRLGWPKGITVDEANSRIYWVDAINEHIATTRFDGSNRQHIDVSKYPNGIDILGDVIFWSDSEDEEIMVLFAFSKLLT